MMTETLKFEIEAIGIVHIVAIILAIIFFMMFYMKAQKDHALMPFLALQVSTISWMVFKIFKTVSPTVLSRWWFIVGYYAAACVLEVAFLEFGYAYYKKKPIPSRIKAIIYILPISQIIVVATNPYHYLFYSRFDFWGDSFGVLFYVHTLIEYGFIAVGFVYCYKMFNIRFRHKNVFYKYFVSSAIIVPLILNFLYITKVIHRFIFALGVPIIFDITPIIFTWTTMVFAYATFRHDFINVSPIMQHEIVHKLDTPIGVLDSSYDLIYINEKLDAMFDYRGMEVVKKALSRLNIRDISNDVSQEIEIEDHYINLLKRPVYSLKETQYLLTLGEITTYRNVENGIITKQKELDESNETLNKTIDTLIETSKTGARNFVARELHDIIGHSLVVAIKLLEVSRLYFTKNKELSLSALADVVPSIQGGIDQMREIALSENQNILYTTDLLKKELTRSLERMKHSKVKTNIHFKGDGISIDEKVYDVIKKVTTELLTNALKHSEATEIFISASIKKDGIHMMIMDNGIGCDELVKGNGLSGIEYRLGLIDGDVNFISSDGEGFMSKIFIRI